MKLTDVKIVQPQKMGRTTYYVNWRWMQLLGKISGIDCLSKTEIFYPVQIKSKIQIFLDKLANGEDNCHNDNLEKGFAQIKQKGIYSKK